MPHQDLVILFPIWACMALVTLVHTQASLGPGYSLYSWASPGPVDCGPTWASPGRGDWFPQGPHLDVVTQVLIWASWDLVSQFHIGASPGPSDSVPHLGLHGPRDSGPHPGIFGTWILYSTPGPHFDQGPLVPFWASN